MGNGDTLLVIGYMNDCMGKENFLLILFVVHKIFLEACLSKGIGW